MAKKIAYLGMLLALAIVLGWLENLIPIQIAIPGVKVGLANIVTLLILYRFGAKDACLVGVTRVILSSLLFGNLSVMLYSMAGMVGSLILMCILKKVDCFSIVGVSILGGIMHNFCQLLVAIIILQNKVLIYYFPVLFAVGAAAGVLVGLLGAILHRYLPDHNSDEN